MRILARLALFAIFLPGLALAQGDDFPFLPNVPPWNQPQVPAPIQGLNYTTGSKGWQKVWGAKAGGKIRFQYVLDWGIPQSTSPFSWGLTNMRYTEPTDGTASRQAQWYHGNGLYFCLRCSWEADVTQDDPELEALFQGSDWFDMHFEVTEIIPPKRSWFSVFGDFDKQIAGAASNALWASSWATYGAATAFSYFDLKLGLILGVIAHFEDKGAGALAAVDPWDGDYCSESPLVVNYDYEWVRGYDDTGWLADSGEMIEAYGNQAVTATNRAFSAWSDGAEGCAWWQRAQAISALGSMGDWMRNFTWVIAQTADNYSGQYDMSGLYGQVDGLGWIASWLRGLQ